MEFTYKRRAVSFRSGIKDVCAIYYSGKMVAELIPGRDGWEDDEIHNVVDEFIDAGIKRKFVGYNLKDVDMD